MIHRSGNVNEGRQHHPLNLIDVCGVAYGTRVRGQLPAEFQQYLWSSASYDADQQPEIDMSYKILQRLPVVDEFWIGKNKNHPGNGRFALFRQSNGFGLKINCQGQGLFRITDSSIEIEWMPGGTGPAHYLFAFALPLWVEYTGGIVLHASAVSLGGRSVAFLGRSGIGKSTLCSALIQSGLEFVADDGLTLWPASEKMWRCSHGPPVLKLWPSALEDHTEIELEKLTKIHDNFEKRLLQLSNDHVAKAIRSSELAAVFVLERHAHSDRALAISNYSPSESLMQLIEFSLANAPAVALGLSASRLKKLAGLVENIGVKCLKYPTGWDQWEPIKDLIINELEGSSVD